MVVAVQLKLVLLIQEVLHYQMVVLVQQLIFQVHQSHMLVAVVQVGLVQAKVVLQAEQAAAVKVQLVQAEQVLMVQQIEAAAAAAVQVQVVLVVLADQELLLLDINFNNYPL